MYCVGCARRTALIQLFITSYRFSHVYSKYRLRMGTSLISVLAILQGQGFVSYYNLSWQLGMA